MPLARPEFIIAFGVHELNERRPDQGRLDRLDRHSMDIELTVGIAGKVHRDEVRGLVHSLTFLSPQGGHRDVENNVVAGEKLPGAGRAEARPPVLGVDDLESELTQAPLESTGDELFEVADVILAQLEFAALARHARPVLTIFLATRIGVHPAWDGASKRSVHHPYSCN